MELTAQFIQLTKATETHVVGAKKSYTCPSERHQSWFIRAERSGSQKGRHRVPAHRKSLQVLSVSGALKAKPSRYAGRTDGPVCPGELGKPPAHLSTAAKNVWAEIADNAPENMLKSADRLTVEIACKLVCSMRNRRTPVTNGELSLLTTVLGRLGFNPTDRAKIPVEPVVPEDPHDPWKEFD